MSCSININKEGYLEVKGENSEVFYNALREYGNEVDAINTYYVSLSEEFTRSGLSPTLKNIESFNESYNAVNTSSLTPKQKMAIYNAGQPEDFISAVEKDGRFILDRTNMSSFYTDEEIDSIFSDLKVQREIRDIYNKLKNNPEAIQEVPTRTALEDIREEEHTSIGTYKRVNPDELYTKVGQEVSGLETVEEVEEALQNSGDEILQQIENSEKILQEFSNKRTVRTYSEDPITGEVVPKTENSTRNTLLYSFDVEQDTTKAQTEIRKYLETITDSVNKPQLKIVEVAIKNLGIDVRGLSENPATVFDVRRYLRGVLEFIQNPGSLEEFVELHDEFFGIVENSEVYTVVEDHGNNTMVINTNTSDLEMYKEHSVVRIKDNIYKKVQKSEDIYEDFYTVLTQDESKIPNDFLPNLRGRALTETRNKEKVKQQIQEEVKRRAINNLKQGEDLELSEELTIFNILHNTEEKKYSKLDYYNNIKRTNDTQFKDNFLRDFQKYVIKNNLNLPVVFTQKGLEQQYEGAYTAQEIYNSLPEGLQQRLVKYAQLTGNMSDILLFNTEILPNEVVNDKDFDRNFYTNFPQSLPTYTGVYSFVSDTDISTVSKEPFIRVRGEIYERTNENIYTKVDEQEKIDWNRSTPKTSIKVKPDTRQQETTPIQIIKKQLKEEAEFCN